MRAWWSYYPPEALTLAEQGNVARLPAFSEIVCSWDTAFKEKTSSDPVAGGIWGIVGPDLLSAAHAQRAGLAPAHEDAHARAALVGDRALAAGLLPRADREQVERPRDHRPASPRDPGIAKYNPGNLDKTQRAIAASDTLESGNVFICGVAAPPFDELGRGEDYNPALTPAWAAEVVEQCAKFPKAANDDLVDMVTQLINWQRVRGLSRTRVYSPADIQLPAMAGVPTGGGFYIPLVTRVESAVSFLCEECGTDFTVKARYARMIRCGEGEQKCRRCLRRGKASPVTDTDRRFWLTRFDDTSLASIACAFFEDIPFNPGAFSAAREIVMGTPEVMTAAAVPPERKIA